MRMNRPLGQRCLAALAMASIVALAACSGAGTVGAGGTAGLVPTAPGAKPPATGHHHKLKVKMLIKVPRKRRHHRYRKGHHEPRFISNATAGIIVNVYSAGDLSDSIGIAGADISSSSPACANEGADARECTFFVPAPPGNDVFVAQTYDAAPTGTTPNGNLLAVGTSNTIDIAVGQANTASFTVDGVVASAGVVVPNAIVHGTISNSQNIAVVGLDADGTPIITDSYADANGNGVTINVAMSLVGSAGSTNSGGCATSPPAICAVFTNGSAQFFLQNGALTAPMGPGGDNLQYNGQASIDLGSCSPGSPCSGAFVNTITATPSNAGATAGSATITLLGPTITQYPLTGGLNGPITGVTLGTDGNLWFADSGSAGIGKITPGGTMTAFSGPSGATQSITTGSDGNLWFTEPSASNVGAMNVNGVMVTEVQATSTPGADPSGITSGSDGNIWYTMNAASSIGRVTIPGHIVSAPIGSLPHNPLGIATVQGKLVWGNSDASVVGVGTTSSGTASFFTAPGVSPILNVAPGPDNNAWFTLPSNNLGVLSLPGLSVAELPLPCCRTATSLVTGADGNLYFTDSGNGTIGFTNTAVTNVTELPNLGETPISITVGPDGNIWFGESTHIGEYSW
jgi:streptogramin lyase